MDFILGPQETVRGFAKVVGGHTRHDFIYVFRKIR